MREHKDCKGQKQPVEFVQHAMSASWGYEECTEQEAEMILAMADIKGDRKLSYMQIFHVADLMAQTKKVPWSY